MKKLAVNPSKVYHAKMRTCRICRVEKPLTDFYFTHSEGRKYYRTFCKPCARALYKKEYRKNRDHYLSVRKKWQAANHEKVVASRKKNSWKVKMNILTHYGGKCVCCGESIPEFLSIDHINNDGYKIRSNGKGRKGISSFYYWIKKNGYPTDLQILCYNCNCAKGFFGKCPHKNV